MTGSSSPISASHESIKTASSLPIEPLIASSSQDIFIYFFFLRWWLG
ncbi:hypothetical protein AWRI1631_122340 [Saccharomyces cerevisiae AWRI1631]|uniref:Uncharacterized protein n=1 Tax=Saccharomyces cerevisiae (strain AWRI1631) TaxID=545124 RepID=B5VNB2_YEAS6|nr:hypothetical protein AWRI1631_122340 [Saccharomyces cerevisiae AWRI1631]